MAAPYTFTLQAPSGSPYTVLLAPPLAVPAPPTTIIKLWPVGAVISLSLSVASAEVVRFARTPFISRSYGTIDSQSSLVANAVAIRRKATFPAAAALVPTKGAGFVNYPKAVSTVTAQAMARAIVVSVARITFSGQTAARVLQALTSRSAANAHHAAVVAAALHVQLLGVGLLQVYGLRKLAGVLRSAVNSQVSAFTRLVSSYRILGAVIGQAALAVRAIGWIRSAASVEVATLSSVRAYFRALSAASVESSALARLVAVLRGVASVEVTTRKLSVLIARAAVDAQSAAVQRASSLVWSAANAQVAARAALVSIARAAVNTEVLSSLFGTGRTEALSATDSNVANLPTPTYNHAGVNTPLSLPLLETQAAKLVKATGLIRGATNSMVTAYARLLSALRLLGAASTEAIGLQRLTSARRTAVLAQALVRQLAVSTIRGAVSAESAARSGGLFLSRTLSAATVQAAAMQRSIGALRSAITAQAFRVARLVNTIKGQASAQATRRSLAILKAFTTSSAEAAALTPPLRAIGRAYNATSSEAAALLRVGLHAISAALASTSATRLAKALAVIRSATNLQVGRTAAAVGKLIALALAESVGAATMAGRVQSFIVKQAQALSSSAAFRHFGAFAYSASVISTGIAAIAKSTAKAFTVTHSTVVTVVPWYFRFVPLALRGRVVRLPDQQSYVALPPSARRVTLPDQQLLVALPPAVRRVVLPKEGDDYVSDYQIDFAQPAYFSPLDPTDTDSFTFDWSTRAFPNDTIVFASIISVPSGVNFIGPVFISGQTVTITVGPFVIVPPLPTTYSLRCMCMFGSGRISNFSVPFIVRSL